MGWGIIVNSFRMLCSGGFRFVIDEIILSLRDFWLINKYVVIIVLRMWRLYFCFRDDYFIKGDIGNEMEKEYNLL